MRWLVYGFVVGTQLSASIANAADAHVGTADLIAYLQKMKPHFTISGQLAPALVELTNEQKNIARGATSIGISVKSTPNAFRINIHGASKRRTSLNTSGIFLLNELNNLVFGQKVRLPDNRYYLLGFSPDVSWLSNVRLIDSDGRQSSLSIPANGYNSVIYSDPLKGPDISIIFDDVPTQRMPRSWSYTDMLVLDWPADENAVLADTDLALVGNSTPSPTPTPAPLRYKYTLPSDFVDAKCAFENGLSASFANDLRQFASSVGLIQNIRRTDDGKRVLVNYCTGSLASTAGGRAVIVTSNSCINGRFEKGIFNKRTVSTKIFWDYRNANCSGAPPPRWRPTQIADLPATHVTELIAIDTANDVVVLSPDTAPPGRTPLVVKGGSDPAELFRFILHHSDLRPLLGTYQLRFAPADPTVTTAVTSPPPCTVRPGDRFAYSLPILDGTSSAVAGGGNGAPVLGQATSVIEIVTNVCRDIFQTNPADFSVNGRVDPIVAGMH